MELTENRFAHLLQPIRELTKNWDIDVASELNDYLEDLDEMCIEFDGGKIRLNFAEAALLIQGSACIYSKKVEMLHNLVYQTLEYINDRNRKRNKHASDSEEGGANAEQNDHDEDDEAEFAPLDIVSTETTETLDVKMTVGVTPLPPEALIPPEAFEKNRLPLISVKGEVLCSQKDFRMNLFIPGDRDMIVLSHGASAHLERDTYTEAGLSPLPPPPPPPSPPHQQQQQQQGAESLITDDAAADDFFPLDDHEAEPDQGPEEHVLRHQAPAEGRMIRERRPVETEPEKDRPPAVNVWALHDPYDVLGEERPLKPGKCYKVPEGLDDKGKRKRKRASPLQDFRNWFRGTFDPPEHKLKNGPKHADMNYIYLSTMKDKLRTQRRIFRKAGAVVSDEDLRRTFLQPEEAEPPGEEPADGFRHPDPLGGDGDHSDDGEHQDFPDDVPAEFGGGDDFVLPDSQKDQMSYEDLVTLRVEQLVQNCRGYTQETSLSRRVKDWEDKIRPELALQEERPPFDIHDYGDRIVHQLRDVGQRRFFSSLVQGLDNFEACKYLLASLQLANDYTVEVDQAAGLDQSLDSMALTLLSTHRVTDRFKTGDFALRTAAD